MSEVEIENIIRPRDILLAVEDIDVSGMEISKVTKLIQSKSTAKN
jgi:hypoxanthine-guanine phosphoribosyltransferase